MKMENLQAMLSLHCPLQHGDALVARNGLFNVEPNREHVRHCLGQLSAGLGPSSTKLVVILRDNVV